MLTVGGEIDVATVVTLQSAISEALADRPTALVVDLTGVDFLASAGLQVLVATHESIGESAGFAVVADGPATSRPIQLTGLDQILSLHPTLAEAVAALNGAPSRRTESNPIKCGRQDIRLEFRWPD